MTERISLEVGDRENARLKREREGSLEPAAEPSTQSATTKKNRLAKVVIGNGGILEADGAHSERSPERDLDKVEEDHAGEAAETLDSSAKDVGEVRKKVEDLTWKEGEGKEPIKENDSGPDALRAADVEKGDEHEEEGLHDTTNKELKRKALDRSQSSFVKDEEDAAVKRPKDTPSPPPVTVPETHTAPPKKSQATFSSFSSASSPFAGRSASPFTASATSSSTFGTSNASAKSIFAGSGFGTYSSTSSPFGTKKGNALPAKEPLEEQTDRVESSSRSFGDILSSAEARDEEDVAKVHMTEQDVATGEEDEETVHSMRTKLYIMQTDGGWRERGVGTLRLNVRKSDGKGARLVMRAEGVLRLILNVSLYVGMNCLEDGKHVRLTVFEESERRFITFRTASNKAASELAASIHQYIPLEAVSSPKAIDAAKAV